MEVILVKEVERLGKAGQRASVNAGYARNFLFPRSLAVPATRAAGTTAQARLDAQIRTADRAFQKASELARRLAEISCVLPIRVGEQGKLYGAVTAAHIVRALQQQGISVERRQIQLGGSLTHLGEVQVPVKLQAGVKAFVKVVVANAAHSRASG